MWELLLWTFDFHKWYQLDQALACIVLEKLELQHKAVLHGKLLKAIFLYYTWSSLSVQPFWAGFWRSRGFLVSSFLLLPMWSSCCSLPWLLQQLWKKDVAITQTPLNIFLLSVSTTARGATSNLGIYKEYFSKLPFLVRYLLSKASRYPCSHIKKLLKLLQDHLPPLSFLQKSPCTNQKNPSFGVFPGAHILHLFRVTEF